MKTFDPICGSSNFDDFLNPEEGEELIVEDLSAYDLLKYIREQVSEMSYKIRKDKLLTLKIDIDNLDYYLEILGEKM